MTGKKPPTSRKLVRQKVGPVDKRSRKRGLTVAVRTAIDAMIYDRCNRAEACEKAGITERALYLALEKPEVATYFNAALVLLRQGERPRNIHRLAEIRDAGSGTPAVNAIRALELLSEADEQPGGPGGLGRQQTPGIVIRINYPSAPPHSIDVTPRQVIERDQTAPRPVSPQAFDLQPSPPRQLVEHEPSPPSDPIFKPRR